MWSSKEEFVEYMKGIKFWLERARGIISWVSYLLIFDMWRINKGYDWDILIIVGIPVGILILIIDYKKLYPNEARSSTRANPEWADLRKDVTEIKEHLLKNVQ